MTRSDQLAAAPDNDLAGPQRRHIHEVLVELHNSLDLVAGQLSDRGAVSEDARKALQQDVLSAITVLRKYRHNDAVDWESLTPVDGGPDEMLKRVVEGRETVSVRDNARNPDPEPEREPLKFDVWTLINAGLDLDDMASTLGFAPQAQGINQEESEVFK